MLQSCRPRFLFPLFRLGTSNLERGGRRFCFMSPSHSRGFPWRYSPVFLPRHLHSCRAAGPLVAAGSDMSPESSIQLLPDGVLCFSPSGGQHLSHFCSRPFPRLVCRPTFKLSEKVLIHLSRIPYYSPPPKHSPLDFHAERVRL